MLYCAKDLWTNDHPGSCPWSSAICYVIDNDHWDPEGSGNRVKYSKNTNGITLAANKGVNYQNEGIYFDQSNLNGYSSYGAHTFWLACHWNDDDHMRPSVSFTIAMGAGGLCLDPNYPKASCASFALTYSSF